MSEAELHILRSRMRGGILSKARRGELRTPLPIGLTYDPLGKVTLDPDVAVRAAVALLLETFKRTGAARATVREFADRGLLFPQRVHSGEHKGELVWAPLAHDRVLHLLHNPRYAGAFCYGRRQQKHIDGKRSQLQTPREEWIALIQDAHPGYITFAQFEQNQATLAANDGARGTDRHHSPPREGPALLQGLVVCGRCGKRMAVRYHHRRGQPVPDYACERDAIKRALHPACQIVAGERVDQAVGEMLLGHLTPLALAVALEVATELEHRADQADQLRQQHIERARYDAELARRRYLAVEPDNRLVANDVTLLRDQQITAHVRLKGGQTHTLTMPLPLSAAQLRHTSPELIEQIDRLLEDHTEGETADILNQRGERSFEDKPFTATIVQRLRTTHRLATRHQRLHARGMLTRPELARQLGVHPSTIHDWRVAGLLTAHKANDKPEWLYEPPADSDPRLASRRGWRLSNRERKPSTPGGAV